jgi:hypothetical protein
VLPVSCDSTSTTLSGVSPGIAKKWDTMRALGLRLANMGKQGLDLFEGAGVHIHGDDVRIAEVRRVHVLLLDRRQVA